jgi:hypothetical protein
LGSITLDNQLDTSREELDKDVTKTVIPFEILGGGDHFKDLPTEVKQLKKQKYNNTSLPRERLAEFSVLENNYKRPRPKGMN